MATKNTYIVIGAAALIIYIMSTVNSKAFASPTASKKIRGCDPKGCGGFGASRGGRKHNGIDLVAAPGEAVFAPITGTVTRHPFPYGDDLSFKGIEIVNADYKVKMFYLSPSASTNSAVKQGQQIGVAQNIAAKHGGGMVNHVHMEVYDIRTGKLIDPTNLIE